MLQFRTLWVCLLAGILVAICAPLAQVAAQEAPVSSLGDWIADRPDPAGTPTKVQVGLHVFDIDSIDDVTQQFSIDMFLNVRWRDGRLALPLEQRAGRVRTFEVQEIWTPRGIVVNDRGLDLMLPRLVEVDDLGNVRLQQRVAGTLSANLEFREFPFDVQRLPIDFISYKYSATEVEFSEPVIISGSPELFSAEGWELSYLQPDIGVYTIPQVDASRARLTFLVKASRDADYYLTTMFMPMALIVFMAWTVFWLQPDMVPARISLSTASIFSLIAFGFSIRLSLPKISYLTRADTFVLGSTLLVFVALAVAVIGSRWAVSGRMGQAVKLSAICRVVYPLLLLLVAAIARLA